MLQLDNPTKKELEAQLDGAIMQLQDELGLTKKQAKELEKKLNKDLKKAIKSKSLSGGESIDISIVEDSIEIKVVPGTTTTEATTTAGTTTSTTTTTTTAAGCAGGWMLNKPYCITTGTNVCFTFTSCPTSAAVEDTIGKIVNDFGPNSVVLNSFTSNKEISVKYFRAGVTFYLFLRLSDDGGNSFTTGSGTTLITYSITP